MDKVNFEAKTTWVQDEIVYPADVNRWEQGIKDCADGVNAIIDELPALPYLPISEKGKPNGVASLDSMGKVPSEQLPSFKNVGEVFFSQSSSATDNPGALPAWTGEYYSNGSSLYPDLYNWVKSHSELQTTKTEYDNAISLTGSCAKYVVDEVSGSLRLPKLTNYIKMADSVSGLTQSEAGLPNITGTFVTLTGAEGAALSGAFYDTGQTRNNNAHSSQSDPVAGFDASRSSSVYGNSPTVTPAHTTLYPWIYAFNSAVSASVAQAAEFTGALSGKANADLSNLPAGYDYVVESYSDDEGNWYRLYKSGWVEQGGRATTSQTVTFLKPYRDTESVYLSCGPYNGQDTVLTFNSVTATSFTSTGRNTGGSGFSFSFYWTACGQGA